MADAVEPGFTIQCRELVELVTEYLEGTLDSDTRAEFEAHLAICPGCMEYVQQMRTTLHLVGDIPVDDLSDEAKAALLAAFRDFRPAS
jgi:anti-sigma factor RsiW